MKKPTAEVLAELTGDTTVSEVASHNVWFSEACDCKAADDHDRGQEVRDA